MQVPYFKMFQKRKMKAHILIALKLTLRLLVTSEVGMSAQ